MSLNAYEVGADGSEFDETWVNQIAVALGRINNVSINPINCFDYVYWRSEGGIGDTYYAKNNATGVVTSNAACHTLVNGLLADNKTNYFVGHTFPLTGAINLGAYQNVGIYGSPRKGTTFEPADTINAFEFDENWYCVLKDFYIHGINQTTSGMGIKWTQATGSVWASRNHIENIIFEDCYIGIGDLFDGANGASVNVFRDLMFYDCSFTDIRFKVNGTGFWWFIRCSLDHFATRASDDYCFRMEGADGLVMDTFTLLMFGASSKGGALIEGTDFIWMNNCDIEKAGLTGWNFTNCRFGKFTNLRMHEAGMAGGATGEACIRLQGCRDFAFSNTSLNITYNGVTNHCLRIFQDGDTVTESDRINFIGGHISSSTGYGVATSDASSYVKFLGMNFYGNANGDVFEEDTVDYNTYKSCSFESGNGWTLIGEHNTYDQHMLYTSDLDLSGGATNNVVFHANSPCVLAGYKLLYTEASSGNAGVDVRIGRYQDGVALDDDYFAEETSDINLALGASVFYNTASLNNHVIAASDTLTVGTAGGKVGTGEVKHLLYIIELAS